VRQFGWSEATAFEGAGRREGVKNMRDKLDGPRIDLTRRDFGKAAAGLGALAAMGIGAPAVHAQTGMLKVGVLLPRSGLLAEPGQACQRGADIAPKVLADLGYKIEILSADTESSADVARSRTEKLIDDGAQVIIGAFESAQTIAAAQVCEQRGIPLVINIAAAPQITEQGYKTLVRNFPTSIDLVTNGMALMKDLFRVSGITPKTAVLIHANDTFGQANRAAIDKLLPGLDMPFKLVASIAYDPKAQDLAVEVSKAKSIAAELVLVTTRSTDAIKLVREMVKQRYEPMALISPGSPGMYDEQFYKVLGKYSDYAISNVPWYDPTSEVSKRAAIAFKAAFPNDRFETNAFNAGFTLDAILIAADAFKRAGTAEPKALLDALKQTNLAQHMMVGPPIRFDAKGQNVSVGSAAVQNLNQTPTVVLPESAAAAKPIFPAPGWTKRG
jgi:branched-chain amino acid transport system substrate-binding protein